MFSLGAARYFLYREPTDIRKSFDGLCGLVSIFLNRPRNRIKLLRWEAGGFVLFYKRLEKGTFELPGITHEGVSHEIDYGELAMIITGISMKYAKKRRRFYPQNSVDKYR
jgi:transposase